MTNLLVTSINVESTAYENNYLFKYFDLETNATMKLDNYLDKYISYPLKEQVIEKLIELFQF